MAPIPPEASSSLAIVGAGGVGATVAYACLIRGLARRVALYDTDEAKALAQAADLRHGLPYCPADAEVDGGADIALCADADVIVVTAGAKQRPGESRLDLADRNAALVRTLLPQLMAAAPRATLLMVTNPVDVLTAVALEVGGLDRSRAVGSGTVLDSARFRTLIAQRLRLSPRDVQAHIVGEHGESEIPLWSTASISGVPLRDWSVMGHGRLDVRARSEITQQTRTAAAEIVAGKGATTYAIGLCAAEVVEALLSPTPRVLTVSARVDAKDAIADIDGVCLSVPRPVSRAGVEPPLPLTLSDNERLGLQNSAMVLREAKAKL